MKSKYIALFVVALVILSISLYILLPKASEEPSTATTDYSSNTVAPNELETINGIEVPPEPDPEVNKATLAGVDVNGNGVRDDVERVIASKVLGIDAYRTVIPVAQTYQHLLTLPTITQEESDKAMLQIECFAYHNLDLPTGVRDSDIKSLTFNTDSRIEEMQSKTADLNFRVTDVFKECQS